MRYVATGPMADLSVTERLLQDYDAHQKRLGYSFWAVIERASGELIGDAGLYRTPTGEVELGYTLGDAVVGARLRDRGGVGVAGVRVLSLGIFEVVALAEPANVASMHVLEKLGMRRSGERIAFGRPHAVFRTQRAPQASPRSTRVTLDTHGPPNHPSHSPRRSRARVRRRPVARSSGSRPRPRAAGRTTRFRRRRRRRAGRSGAPVRSSRPRPARATTRTSSGTRRHRRRRSR